MWPSPHKARSPRRRVNTPPSARAGSMPAGYAPTGPSSVGAASQGFDGDFLGQAKPPYGPVEVNRRWGLPDLRVQARRGNQVLEEHRWGSKRGIRPGLPVAERRHRDMRDAGVEHILCDASHGLTAPAGAGRTKRRPEAHVAWGAGQDSTTDGNTRGHSQRPGLFVRVVGRRPHRMLGFRRNQRPAAAGHLRSRHCGRGPRLRFEAGWQHRVLGRRRLRPGHSRHNRVSPLDRRS